MKEIIGIDIGGTNIRMGYVSPDGGLEHFEKKSSSMFFGDGAVENLTDEIRAYIKKYKLEDKVLAISVGVPSMVSKDKSFVYSTPNLKGLENMDLGHLLQKALDIPVYVDRDVNYLLINDIKKYNLDPEGDKTIIGMYLGTGFGNAIYINGSLHVGKNGVAGELGHIPFYGLTDSCTCGNEGCCEARCSGMHLQRICAEHFPDTNISDVFTKHSNHPEIQNFIDTLAIPISTEITILDPDYVIMGGGVMIMKDFPMERLIKQIKHRTRHPLPSENIEFVFPEHTQTGGVIGGAYSSYANF